MKVNIKVSHISLILLTCFLPAIALAQFSLGSSTFRDVVLYIIDLISILVPILFAGAFIFFFWGLSKFIINAGNAAELAKGKSYMLWGILALFVLITFRTIISLFTNDLGVGGAKVVPILQTDASTMSTGSSIKFDGQ